MRQTSNINAKDKFNMKMCKSLQTASGKTLIVSKAAIGEDSDQNGEVVNTGVIITDDGAYGTISATAIELIDALIDMLEESDNEPINVAVSTRKANSGRDYIVLEIAD